MKILQSIKNNIPNTITSLNLLSGAIACVFALKGSTQYGAFTGYEIAFMLIALGALFDFCDGLAARLLNSVSAIGKELDSLSDCVSFGVAPSMLVYSLMEQYNPGSIYNYSAFLIAAFGAIRLAKFNVSTDQSVNFKGLPIPANAIFWIGYVSFSLQRGAVDNEIYMLIAMLCFFMISNIPMFSFKMKNFALKNNFYRYMLVIAAPVLVYLFGVTGLFYTIVLYISLSVICKKFI